MTNAIITAEIVRTTKVSVLVAIAGFARPFRCVEVDAVRDLGDGRIEVGAVDHANMLANNAGLATVSAERAVLAQAALEQVADEDDADAYAGFRAAYWVSADGQGDVLLTTEDEAGLSDADLIEAAVAEAHHCDLIGAVTGLSEDDVRDSIHIGEYRR